MEFLGFHAVGPVTRPSEVAEEELLSSSLSASPGLSVPYCPLKSSLAAGLGFNPSSKAVPIWNTFLSQRHWQPGLELGRPCGTQGTSSWVPGRTQSAVGGGG